MERNHKYFSFFLFIRNLHLYYEIDYIIIDEVFGGDTMKNIVEIKSLCFSYETEEVIKNIDFEVKNGIITTLVGDTGGGKTTLVKLILGLIKGTGQIKILNQDINDKNLTLMCQIAVILGNPKKNFVTDSVLDELVFPLENLQMQKEEMDKYLSDIIDEFDLNDILDRNPQELNHEEASVVAIACALITKPKLLILDDAFTKIGDFWKKKLFRILKKWNQTYQLTILNVTHNIEECLLGKELYLLHHGEIVLRTKVSDLASVEKELKQYHYQLPFMVELSEKLKYYNVIDHTILDMSRMVNTIWK